MPLIRYSIGDAGRPSDTVCSCGRGLPLVKSIDGRVTDFIYGSNKKYIPGPAFIYMFSDLPVRKYQIIQTEINKLTVKIVADTGYSNTDDQKIVTRIKQIVGPEFAIDINHVSSIPSSSRSGKFLAVISKISSFSSS